MAGMKYDSDKHHRRSIRLKGYDYNQAGMYFVTVVTQDRMCLFGEIENGAMRLNDAGWIVQAAWDELPAHYAGIKTDVFVVMPNHIHGIVVLVGAGPRACPDAGLSVTTGPRACPDAGSRIATSRGARPATGRPQGGAPTKNPPAGLGQPQGVAPTLSLPDIMHRFKTLTTKRFIDAVKQSGWTPFPGRLWQRNYYEHIVRDEESLNRIRQYIHDNPARWEFDLENPAATALEPEDAWRD